MLYRLDNIEPKLEDETVWVAPDANVIGRVQMASESSVWFGVTIRGDNDPITIGKRSNMQDHSVIHTDIGAPVSIGENVTVGHKAMLHGCTIGDNSLVGMGATILNGARIGTGSVIGAAAVVTEGVAIPPNVPCVPPTVSNDRICGPISSVP